MITSSQPKTWQELEEKVAEILEKSGLEVHRKRAIETVRGKVEIDVWAAHNIKGHRFVAFCECKNWNSPVPQTVVHGFRTVVADGGANIGYIISKSGFQSGADKAAASSNIKLLTWAEFQDEFEVSYYENYFRKELEECSDGLCTFTEPISPGTFLASGRLPEENLEEFERLQNKYMVLSALCLPQYPKISEMMQQERLILPLSTHMPPDARKFLPPGIPDIVDYEGFLSAVRTVSTEGIAAFRKLLRVPKDASDE